MRRHTVPRWLRTALLFFASLQAARAGSVDAQNLGNPHVERAAASSAPRDPLPACRQQAPLSRTIVLSAHAADRFSAESGSRHTAGPSASLRPARRVLSQVGAMAAAAWKAWRQERVQWAPWGPVAASTSVPAKGAFRARAPCTVSVGN